MAVVNVNAGRVRVDAYTHNEYTGEEVYTPGSWRTTSGDSTLIREGFWEWIYHNVTNMTFEFPAASVTGTISALTVNLNLSDVSTSAEIRFYLCDALPGNYIDPSLGNYVQLQTKNVSSSSSSFSVTFSNLNVDATKKLYLCVCPHHKADGYPLDMYCVENSSANITVNYPSFGMGISPTAITTQDTAVATFSGRMGRSVSLTIQANNVQLSTATVNADTYTITPQMSWFSTAHVTAMSMQVRVNADDGLRTPVSGQFTLSKPQLSFSFQYATRGTGETQKITFTNKLSQAVTLHFDYAGVQVTSDVTVAASANTYSFTPTLAWFTTAGVTNSTMSVNVTATDGLNRSYKTNFQLKRSAVVANVSPAGGASVTATDEMTWTWSVTGGTTQKSAKVYINDTLAGTVDRSTTSWTSDYRPAAGSVSWYVEVTNNLDIVSRSTATSYTLTYGGQSKLEPVNSTTSGYILRKAINTFSVQIIRDPDYGTPEHDYTLSSPKFYYKKSSAGTWTSVNMTRYDSNRAAYVSIAANTFTADEYNWYVQATDNEGNTRTTATYTIDASAAPITATPVSPVDKIENQNTETVFVWADSSPIESPQQAAELQWSTDNSTWTSLGSVSNAATEYHAPAGAITISGTIWWRVRAQNTDSAWGDWSSGVSYINFGAPVISNVVATNRPRTTISWTVDNQQAYRVTIDSTVYGPFFGADNRSYQIPDYLADGAHRATVEAQNEYGQWSTPVSTNFSVTNVPGGTTVSLQGVFRRDAELGWSSDSSSQEFFVLRDGVKIARVLGYEFLDRTVLGFHTWEILLPLAGGYYAKSNAVFGTLCAETIAIAPLSGGEWLDLERSTDSGRSVTYNLAQSVSVRQFAGQVWPTAEASPYRMLSVSFDVAWAQKDKAQADAFADLIGKPVIWKDCEGAMIGILTAFTRSNSLFYRAFNATIQRIHWEDYIDENR